MASLINTVRATVLSIANKNNFGYITPNDFNLYAKQAQLDIFEDYFYQYNSQIVKQNTRVSGSDYADIVKNLEEVINIFSEQKILQPMQLPSYTTLPPESTSSGLIFTTTFSVPTIDTTGSNYYLLNKVLLLTKYLVAQSINTAAVAPGNILVDDTKDFYRLGVQPGDMVVNLTSGETAYVTNVPNNYVTQIDSIELSANIFPTSRVGDYYNIFSMRAGVNECEKVTQSKITMLSQSALTTPTELFPAYSQDNKTLQIYPKNFEFGYENINPGTKNTPGYYGRILCQYIRYPKTPNWTYVQFGGGEPAFDETAADYQNFELPLSDETNLVNKILQYAGVSIRDAQIAAFGKAEEMEANKQEGQ